MRNALPRASVAVVAATDVRSRPQLQLMGMEVPGFAGGLLDKAHDLLGADSLRPAREQAASLTLPLPPRDERRADLQVALLRAAARLREPAVSTTVIGTLLPGELPHLVASAHLDRAAADDFIGAFLADFLDHGAVSVPTAFDP